MSLQAADAEDKSGALMRPLKKNSVVNLVIDRLKEAMMNKEIVPGDFLPSETELVKNLGVGKTSVREALKMLEAMGVVEIRQGYGTYIPLEPQPDALSPLMFQLILEQASTDHLLELRKIFEPAYSLLAMEKATEADLADIAAIVSDFEAKIKEGTQTAEDDLKFHERIMACTRNPFVMNVGLTIHQLFKASVNRSMRKIPDIALRDHRAIFDAFRKRDGRALQAAILRSYEGWADSLGKSKE